MFMGDVKKRQSRSKLSERYYVSLLEQKKQKKHFELQIQPAGRCFAITVQTLIVAIYMLIIEMLIVQHDSCS